MDALATQLGVVALPAKQLNTLGGKQQEIVFILNKLMHSDTSYPANISV
tara:strand:- start:533 stop:679 length:147 start_codon:yes stop_codon:yes gene_type:complete